MTGKQWESCRPPALQVDNGGELSTAYVMYTAQLVYTGQWVCTLYSQGPLVSFVYFKWHGICSFSIQKVWSTTCMWAKIKTNYHFKLKSMLWLFKQIRHLCSDCYAKTTRTATALTDAKNTTTVWVYVSITTSAWNGWWKQKENLLNGWFTAKGHTPSDRRHFGVNDLPPD